MFQNIALRVVLTICLVLLPLYSRAIEYNNAEYDVYVGDIDGDGENDIYLKAAKKFILIHG